MIRLRGPQDVRERLNRARESLRGAWWEDPLVRDWGAALAFLALAGAVVWLILSVPLGAW